MSENNIKLEDAMKRLDEVLAVLEGENTDLEASLKLYEEGIKLVRLCNEKLSEAERMIKVLKMNADGEIIQSDLDAK